MLTYVSMRAELNDAEQRNIANAMLRRAPSLDELLDEAHVRSLHRAMFKNVWKWAGMYRRRDTNIGVPWTSISTAVVTLIQDARVWVEHETHGVDEMAARFHHRLVWIHPFRNGNGRHARISADYLLRALGTSSFSWGAGRDQDTAGLRSAYMKSLRAAGMGDFGPLLDFVRS